MSECDAAIRRPLVPSELRLVGGGYSLAPKLAVEVDGVHLRIVAQSDSAGSFVLPMLFLAGVFCGLIAFLAWAGGPEMRDGFHLALFVAIGVVAVIGPVVAISAMQKNLKSMNPLVEYSLNTGEVSILAARNVFKRSSIHSLLGVALRDTDGEVKSELQLIESVDEGIRAHRIVGSPANDAAKAFGEIIREFGTVTRVPTALAQATGLSGRGDVVVTELT